MPFQGRGDVRFSGWIPNTSAKLSFSLIGDRHGDHKAVSYNSLAIDGNLVVAIEARPSGDSPGGRYVAKLLNKDRIATQKFLLCGNIRAAYLPIDSDAHPAIKIDAARSQQPIGTLKKRLFNDARGKLVGEIIIILQSTRQDDASKDVWAHVDDFERRVTSTPYLSPIARTDEIVHGVYNRLLDRLNEVSNVTSPTVAFLRVAFELYRTGECHIHVPDRNYEVAPGGEMVATEELQRRIAQQAFVFLKDLTHRHYHHDSYADKKTLVFPSENDDITWRRETLYGLSRMVLEARRKDKIGSYTNALGLIAYAQCFQDTLCGWSRTRSISAPQIVPLEDFAPYDFSSIKASIEARANLMRWTKNNNFPYFALCITIIFGCAAFTFSSVIISQNHDKGFDLPDYYIGTTEFVSHNPIITMVLVPIVLACIFGMIFKVGPFRLRRAYVHFKRPLLAIAGSVYARVRDSALSDILVAFAQIFVIGLIIYLSCRLLVTAANIFSGLG